MLNRLDSKTLLAAGLASLFVFCASVRAALPFTPENQPIGFVAQPRSSSADVRTGSPVVFQIDYERYFWSGNLIPYHIDANGAVDYDADIWPGGAASLITSQNWDTGRKIVTRKDDGTSVAFRWDNMSGAQRSPGLGGNEKYLKYIRGDRSNESPNGDKLRVRRQVLGDIIRSRPLYVPGTVPMVYVGANDGMLHAINGTTGEEVYAYVPSMVIPNLYKLAPAATSTYAHTHFVDASPRSREVVIGGATKRILVGGLGAGGRGLYALDITADSSGPPASESAAASKIMWEVTNTKINATTSSAYANLGYTYGEPVIGRANNDNDVVFMANGYMSTTGKASLFVINPANGSVVREIDTGTGSAGSPNGLSTPTPDDVNSDGKIDVLYAGDLDGRMWKFDVSAASPASWTASVLYTTSPAQAITGAPAIADHPRGGRMVVFGTGRTLDSADMTNTSVHYMYGIWDGAPGGATTLLTQTLSASQIYVDMAGATTLAVRTLSITAPDWTVHRGWKVAMPAGERFVGDRISLTNGRVYAHAYNPTTNQSGASASPPRPVGENWEYQFNFLNGGGSTTPIYDLNRNVAFDNGDLLAGSAPVQDRVPVGRFLAPGVLSQPLVVTTNIGAYDLYTQNANLPAPVIGEPGVSGGHFDVDIYYPGSCTTGGVCSGFQSRKHNHEYDDTFGVTGVNMLNASNPDLNLSKASISVKVAPPTQFKVLVMNQRLNPAAKFLVGPGSGGYVDAKFYGNLASTPAGGADDMLKALETHTSASIQNLVMALPLDAFASKDWWGDGDVRAGLMPTATGCVNKLTDSALNPTPGPGGAWHNGALTVQLIRATTPSIAIELNNSDGDITYGWRVKPANYKSYVLAEWTFFWHHPNGKCWGASGWVKNPPQDTSGARPGTPPPGTGDPKDGTFTAGGTGSLCSGNVVSTTFTYDAALNKAVDTTLYSSGCRRVETTINDGFGNETINVTYIYSDGSTVDAGTQQIDNVDGRNDSSDRPRSNRGNAIRDGRLSWRELIRQ